MDSIFNILSLALAVASFYMAVSETDKKKIKRIVAGLFGVLVVLTWLVGNIYTWNRMNWLQNDIYSKINSNTKPQTFEEIKKDFYQYSTEEVREALENAINQNHVLTTTRVLLSESGKEYEVRLYGSITYNFRE